MTEKEKGWFKCPNELMDCESLTGSEKLVLLSLLRYGGLERECWPSLTTIGKTADLGKKWTIKILKGLEEKGIISVIRTPMQVNRYKVNAGVLSTPSAVSTPEASVLSTPPSVLNTPPSAVSTPEEVYSVHPIKTIDKDLIKKTNDKEFECWSERVFSMIAERVPDYKPKRLPSLIEEWGKQYGEDWTEANIKNALQWMSNTGTKRTEMGRFLGGWLMRELQRNPPKKEQRDVMEIWKEMGFIDSK